jgi:hypothetical protein
LTNVKLIRVLLLLLLLYIIIDIYVLFFMIISGNILNYLSAIQPLNGSNYGSWRETIEIALALMEIDLALTADAPKEPEKPVLRDGETAQAFATRERDFAPIRIAYDLERAKWDASNCKCLMVIKSSIKDVIGEESWTVRQLRSALRRWRVSLLAL